MNKKTVFIIAFSVFLIIAGLSASLINAERKNQKEANNSLFAGKKAVVYKSPTCGCCVKHAAYLEDKGFDVEINTVDDNDSIKEKCNIPLKMQSCHTTVIDDYFVEGHVPVEAIEKLISEKPSFDGITLPGMPSGSPGMPGLKREKFIIYSLTDGVNENFTIL